jgi:hypothetical protein
MNSVLRKNKKQKEKEASKTTVKMPLKKCHSLTDLRTTEPKNTLPDVPDITLNSKDNMNNLFIKKYSSVAKEEKTLQTLAPPMFTTQTQDNFATINENFTEQDFKPLSKREVQPYPKKEQLEIIIFEDEQEKTSNRQPNVLNQLHEEPQAQIENKEVNNSAKDKKLQRECFFNDPLYISKRDISNNDKSGLYDIKFKSLQMIHPNKLDLSFDQQVSPATPVKNESGDVSISQRLDKSLVNCLICFDKTPDSVFMECGHGGNKNDLK